MWPWIGIGSALVIGFNAGMILMSLLQVAARSEAGDVALHAGVPARHGKIGGQYESAGR